jgi:hypothetical protein
MLNINLNGGILKCTEGCVGYIDGERKDAMEEVIILRYKIRQYEGFPICYFQFVLLLTELDTL